MSIKAFVVKYRYWVVLLLLVFSLVSLALALLAPKGQEEAFQYQIF